MSNHFLGWFYHRLSFWWVKNPHLYVPTSICLVGYSNLYIYNIRIMYYYMLLFLLLLFLLLYIYIHITLYIYVCWFPTPQGLVSRYLDPDSWNELLASVGASNEEATDEENWPWKLVPWWCTVILWYITIDIIYIYIVSYVAMMYSNMCDVQLYCNDIVCISYIFIACIYNMTVSIYIHIYTRMCM
jgi:hypothetical protein